MTSDDAREHLERAHDALRRAEDVAGNRIREQVQSIQEGLFEEEGERAEDADAGGRTQLEPGPKGDRVVELEKKLRGLREEADERDTAARLEEAVDALSDYRDERADEAS